MLLAIIFVTVHHHQHGPVFQAEWAQLALILPHLARQPFPCLGIVGTLGRLIKLLLADGATFHPETAFASTTPKLISRSSVGVDITDLSNG